MVLIGSLKGIRGTPIIIIKLLYKIMYKPTHFPAKSLHQGIFYYTDQSASDCMDVHDK